MAEEVKEQEKGKEEVRLTLDHLMRVRGQAEFLGQVIYLRTIGARKDDLRQEMAVSWASEFRRRLRDKESDEYALYIAPALVLDDNGLRESLVVMERHRLRREAETVKELQPEREGVVKEGDGLKETLDAREVDAEQKELTEQKRAAWVDERLVAFRAQYLYGSDDKPAEWGREDLEREVVSRQTNLLAEREYSQRLTDATLLFGCFTDEKCRTPFFKNLTEVLECAPILRDVLVAAYRDVDRFSFNTESLKNLPRSQ